MTKGKISFSGQLKIRC